jgi:ABC-type phosphonate transport system ATPase subunit
VQSRERLESFQREAIEAQRDGSRGAGTHGVLHAQGALPPRLLLDEGLGVAGETEGDVDVVVGAVHLDLRGVVLDFKLAIAIVCTPLGRNARLATQRAARIYSCYR